MKRILIAAAVALSCSACSKPAAPPTTTSPTTQAPTTPQASVPGGAFNSDKVSMSDGPLVADQGMDAAVNVTVGGAVKAIALVSVDAKGALTDGVQYDTWAGETPIPAALGSSFGKGSETWQLGVVEAGAVKNAANGSLTALPAGPHTLTIYAADNGTFPPERHFAVFVERPDGKLERSNIFTFPAR